MAVGRIINPANTTRRCNSTFIREPLPSSRRDLVNLENLKTLLEQRFDFRVVDVWNEGVFNQIVDSLMIGQLLAAGTVEFHTAQRRQVVYDLFCICVELLAQKVILRLSTQLGQQRKSCVVHSRMVADLNGAGRSRQMVVLPFLRSAYCCRDVFYYAGGRTPEPAAGSNLDWPPWSILRLCGRM